MVVNRAPGRIKGREMTSKVVTSRGTATRTTISIGQETSRWQVRSQRHANSGNMTPACSHLSNLKKIIDTSGPESMIKLNVTARKLVTAARITSTSVRVTSGFKSKIAQ